jgi:hypothetical protein
MGTRTPARKTTPAQQDAKPAAKKTAARRAPAKKTPAKPASPALAPLPVRTSDWMTDAQGFATLAALRAGITTSRIQDWRDHRDGSATRPHADGILHYNHTTRALTWQTACPMGAVHEYVLDSPSTAIAARVHNARCTRLHADLTRIPALTVDELTELGILHTPTWAKRLPGEEPITKTIPVLVAEPKPRALADQLAHSTSPTADTQPIPRTDIEAVFATRADQETPKGHPEP